LLPDVPVLFMTGYAPEATADFRELAVASVIAKPFSGDVLRSRVAEMLRVRETQTDRL
jgi:DNA-binding response OmpR family regulator